MSQGKTCINSDAEQQSAAVGQSAVAVQASPFAWRGLPSTLGKERWMRDSTYKAQPTPASQITFSKKTPHSINTISDDSDKAKSARRASI